MAWLIVSACLLILFIAVLAISFAESKKFNITYYRLSVDEKDKLNFISQKLKKSGSKKTGSLRRLKGTQSETFFSQNGQKRWLRFVVLADLHNHQYGQNNEQLVQKIRETNPDFIIVAGDLLTAKPGRTLEVAVNLIERLAKEYPIYYGNGNHEQRLFLYPETYPGMYEQYNAALKKCGVHRLINQTAIIEKDGRRLAIAGLELNRAYYKRLRKVWMEKEALTDALGEKKNEYTILIAHNPEYFDVYADWGADLVLSGHIHGGMVNLPYLGGVISPKIRLFPKYDAGAFRKNNSTMLLSRGLGMHTIPIRLFNRAEALAVELYCDAQSKKRGQ